MKHSHVHRNLYSWILILLFLSTSVIFANAPKTAKIAFTSTRDGNNEIYLMNPDGSEQVNLTQSRSHEARPVWSPTGEHILFKSNQDGEWDLYLMDADGTNVRKIFEELAARSYATWSPDGKRILYTRKGTIYIATRDGQNVEEVTSGISPDWSPDGERIAFVLPSPGKFGQHGLGIFDLQTRTSKMIIPNPIFPYIRGIAWSPDGRKLAFSRIDPTIWAQQTIYTINDDGTNLKRLLKPSRPFWFEAPTWSPRGDEMLYEQRNDGRFQLFKQSLGSRRTRQLTSKGRNYGADWFDPAALSVQPHPDLLTTVWGKLKQGEQE